MTTLTKNKRFSRNGLNRCPALIKHFFPDPLSSGVQLIHTQKQGKQDSGAGYRIQFQINRQSGFQPRRKRDHPLGKQKSAGPDPFRPGQPPKQSGSRMFHPDRRMRRPPLAERFPFQHTVQQIVGWRNGRHVSASIEIKHQAVIPLRHPETQIQDPAFRRHRSGRMRNRERFAGDFRGKRKLRQPGRLYSCGLAETVQIQRKFHRLIRRITVKTGIQCGTPGEIGKRPPARKRGGRQAHTEQVQQKLHDPFPHQYKLF